MPLDVPWAIEQVDDFIKTCDWHSEAYSKVGGIQEVQDAKKRAMTLMPIIQDIADRAWPDWKQHLGVRGPSLSWEYDPMLQLARQLRERLDRQEELRERLGEAGPDLAAASLHPAVWDAAKALWDNQHYGEAVSAAARSVNALIQTKVGRRDESESKLVGECFSPNPPQPGKPRLRLMTNDGSDTYKSIHDGAAAFGRGCFGAIRNVLAHEYGNALAEPPEAVALEYLAAFSVLARWVDAATVDSA